MHRNRYMLYCCYTAYTCHASVIRQTKANSVEMDRDVPAPVHKLHGLHSERRGHDVVSVVPAPPDHHQTVHLPCHEDQTCRSDEAQQAGPGEGELADGGPVVRRGEDLSEVKGAVN